MFPTATSNDDQACPTDCKIDGGGQGICEPRLNGNRIDVVVVVLCMRVAGQELTAIDIGYFIANNAHQRFVVVL